MNKAVNFMAMNNIVNNCTRTDMTYANTVRNTSMENVTTVMRKVLLRMKNGEWCNRKIKKQVQCSGDNV